MYRSFPISSAHPVSKFPLPPADAEERMERRLGVLELSIKTLQMASEMRMEAHVAEAQAKDQQIQKLSRTVAELRGDILFLNLERQRDKDSIEKIQRQMELLRLQNDLVHPYKGVVINSCTVSLSNPIKDTPTKIE